MAKTIKKLTAMLLVAVMVISLLPAAGAQTVYAADEPAPIQDLYEIDGVKYLKIDSNAFETSPTQYILDMMRVMTPKLAIKYDADNFNTYWSCIGDNWLYLGAGLLRIVERDYGTYITRARAMEQALTRGSGSVTYDGVTANGRRGLRSNNLGDYNKAILNYYSLADAEKAVYSEIFNNASLQSDRGFFKDDSRDQTVLVGGAYAETSGTNNSRVGMAVYFSDFQVSPLLPEDSGTNYIQSKTKNVTNEDNIVASNVKNLTPSSVTASQSISRSSTDTVSSSISGSKSYTYSKSIEVSMEKEWKTVGFKMGGKVAVSASKSVSSGWSKSESESASESSSQSVSVTLEPYTNVMLKQRSTTEEWVTIYNCPVALQYTTTIVLYNNNGSVLRHYQFGTDAREDLYNRAVVNPKLNDKEGIDWVNLGYLPITAAAIDLASTYVPMSSAGGAFTETVDTVETDVESILPIYPLYKVKVRAPGVSYISDETYSYGSYNFLNTDMYVGDFSYTNYMALDAFNKFNVEYYGFSKDFGHWIVADKDGNEWTGDDAPVVLEKDPVSKNTAYTAVRPGVCYIKFVIDEDVYNTADHPDVYTKNSDLYQTAAVRINVKDKPFEGTINVGGSFTGYVNDEPRQLDAEGKLFVDICDKTGKEIVKPYVWEAKELPTKGITVDGNMAQFTRTGTFHVRAVSGDLVSDWIEIKVVEPSDVYKAEADAEKAENTAEEAQNAADSALAEADLLQQAADDAKDALGSTYLAEERQKLAEAEQQFAEAEAVLAETTAAVESASEVLAGAVTALETAQAEYDEVAASETATEEEIAAAQAKLDAADAEKAAAQEALDTAQSEQETAQGAYNRAQFSVTLHSSNLEDPPDWAVREERDAQAAYEEAQAAADAAKAAAEAAQAAADAAKAEAEAKKAEAEAIKQASEQKPAAKKANTLTVKGKTATVKYIAVKKAAQKLGVTKVIRFVNKGQGTKSYKKVSGNSKITVNKTTGKVTVKKGLKKGTYKVKVKVKASGNTEYKSSGWKTVTITIKVK